MKPSPDPIDPISAVSRRFRRTFLVVTGLLGLVILGLYFQAADAHRFHNDDAYISFRYSRHLADGLGLVWNPGERVEGYTNFLWVVLIAGGMKLGFAAEPFADVLSIASGAILLFSLAAFAARRLGWASPWILAAPLGLVLNRSFTGWATSGMATMFFAMLCWTAWARFLNEREDPGARPWSTALFALAALTRPDGILFAGLAGLLAIADTVAGRRTRPDFVRWAAPLTAIVASHFLWRRAYYGFWLPNTFHAKINSFGPEHGVLYLSEFHATYAVGFFLPVLVVFWLRTPRPSAVWLTVPLIAYVGYLLLIGGDTFEFRFIVYVLPFLAFLVTDGIRRLATFRARPVMAIVSVVLAGLWMGANLRGADPERFGKFRYQIRSFPRLQAVANTNLAAGRQLKELLDDGTLPRDLVICLATVGALPYVTGLTTIDYHGLNDVRIARAPVAREGRKAHEQEASIEYLKERKVDVHLAGSRGLRRLPTATFNDRTERFQEYWKNVPIGDRWLCFASYVSEERFQEVFGRFLPQAVPADSSTRND